MQFPIHARPSDEVGSLAVVTLATGIEDAENPLANLTTFLPDEIFLTSSAGTAVDILFDHVVATDVKWLSVHGHNLPAGTEIRLQRNDTNTWGAPTIDVPYTIGGLPEDGLPLPFAIDLTLADGYDESGLRYTRIHVPSLAQLVGFGSILLWSAKRTDWDPVLPPNRFGEDQPATNFRTTLGRHRGYRKGIRLRDKAFSMRHDSGWPAYQALRRECSTVLPFAWWFDPTNDTDLYLCKFVGSRLEESRLAEQPDYAVRDIQDAVEEVGYGVAIPTEVGT